MNNNNPTPPLSLIRQLKRRADEQVAYVHALGDYIADNWRALGKSIPAAVVHNVGGFDSATSNIDPRPEPTPKPAPAATTKRVRTGNPVADGLVGVEPNPGPRSGAKERRVKKKVRQPKKKRQTRRANPRFNNGRISVPMVVGSVSNGSMVSMKHKGSRRFLGSEAHFYSGRCAVQALFTNGAAQMVWTSNAVDSNYIFINPRICAQNTGYDVPLKSCPLSTIACAFRKFVFTRLVLHYVPVAATTVEPWSVVFAFDPSVITTTSLSPNVMSYANVEASAYGPAWKGITLDVTKYIDKSKWYYTETPSNIASSIETMSCIQGTFMLAPIVATDNNGDPVPYKNPGIFYLDFDVAFSEFGPTEMRLFPSLNNAAAASSACSKELDEHKEGSDSPVLVSQNPMTQSIHISKSTLASLLNK